MNFSGRRALSSHPSKCVCAYTIIMVINIRVCSNRHDDKTNISTYKYVRIYSICSAEGNYNNILLLLERVWMVIDSRSSMSTHPYLIIYPIIFYEPLYMLYVILCYYVWRTNGSIKTCLRARRHNVDGWFGKHSENVDEILVPRKVKPEQNSCWMMISIHDTHNADVYLIDFMHNWLHN